MEQIKSALEIALEKTANLKRASPEEVRQQKEEAVAVLASGTVQKYLRGEYKLKDLASVSERHQEKALMSQALWKQLVDAVSLEKCDNVLEGLEFLASDKEAVKKLTARVREIGEEFNFEKSERLCTLNDKIGQSARQELSRQGISGSSIEIDVESTPQWHQSLHELEAFFQAKLELVKERLSQLAPLDK